MDYKKGSVTQVIKTVIFDIGNVLVDFRWRKMYEEVFGLEGAELERFADATVRHQAWVDLDQGIITTEQAKEAYAKKVPEYWSKPAYDACKDTALSFLPLVDGVVFSYKELVIKPDKEIYDIICSRYDINPEEAVFLDDTEKNIVAAREFGLHGIHFKSYEQSKAELEELLKQ